MKPHIKGIVLSISILSPVLPAFAIDVEPYHPGDFLTKEQAMPLLERFSSRPVIPWQEPDANNIPEGEEGNLIRYGIEILTNTSSMIGPNAPDESKRYSANNLNCVNCHQVGESGLPGTKPYSYPFVSVINDYPKLDVKTMQVTTLESRIIGMLGKGVVPATPDTPEIQAIVAYMKWLNQGVPTDTRVEGAGLQWINLTARAADPVAGKLAYEERCVACHGAEGLGLKNGNFDQGGGYMFPPIAGDDTYDDGGHVYMIPLLASFIHANMPLGTSYENPKLSVGEAYDIAAYVNDVLPRRHNPNRVASYPEPSLRPEGFAIPENFLNQEDYLRAKFGPFAEHRNEP